MLCGFPPFYSESNAELFKMIRDCDYTFPSPYWDNISKSAKDLVQRIFVANPQDRLTATQILEHPWIVAEGNPTEHMESVPKKIKDYSVK